MSSTASPFRSTPTDAELYVPPAFAEQAQQMLARSQARFGHDAFRMEGDGDGGDGGDGDGDGSGDGDGDGGDGAGKGGAGDGDKGADKDGDKGKAGEKVEDLPDWAQKLIKDARADAGRARTTAKETAAQEARDKLVQDLGKTLGLVKDKDGDKLTPDQLAKQVGEAQATAKQLAVELAVYRGASKKGVEADPDALLDSRGFLAKLADLDPSAKDFSEKVTTAMKDAVKENPKLKASQAGAGSSSADHGSGGSGEGGQRKSKGLAGAVGGHYGS